MQLLPRVLLLMVLGLVAGMSGCSHPGPAPVVNREPGSYKAVTPTGSYRVAKGDTLYSIAWKTGLDHHQLALWNRISAPYRIYPGQRIRLTPPRRYIPRPASKSTAPAATTGLEESRRTSTRRGPKTSSASRIEQTEATGKLQWTWPTAGRLIQTFSASDRSRQGIKIAGKYGQPVLAAEAGKVVYSGSGLIGYGKLIIVKHNNYYLSAYAHNRKILVREDDQVARGERIAEMGRPTDGTPLLHFEIRKKGSPIDPVGLLPRRR